MVVPASFMLFIAPMAKARVSGSKALVGSSSSSLGRAINARVRLTRCCSPPLIVAG